MDVFTKMFNTAQKAGLVLVLGDLSNSWIENIFSVFRGSMRHTALRSSNIRLEWRSFMCRALRGEKWLSVGRRDYSTLYENVNQDVQEQVTVTPTEEQGTQ